MKALVTAPFIPIVPRLASHRSAQGVIYADQIRQTGEYDIVDVNWAGNAHEDHNAYDVVYVYWGSDWTGTLNLFGGVQSFPYAWNIRNFSKFKGKVYSLAIDFPAIDEMIAERIENARKNSKEIQPEWLETDLQNLKRMRLESTRVRFPLITDQVVIGDSHAICMHRPGWTVNSVPFKTLNGALNTGLNTFIEEVTSIDNVASAEFYFGNIDVRHHLCRIEGTPTLNAFDLAKRYVEAVAKLSIKKKAIYELLPIENESRKLPQTGYYKGKPFWGTWEQREDVRDTFNNWCFQLCKENDIQFIEWTDYLLNSKGELDFKYMEKPHSIHLSREFYPHWNGTSEFPVPNKKKALKKVNKSDMNNHTTILEEFFA
jgi:hypothetical protein